MHNEKVKDECLKKVLVYKDKYQDYKTKVRRANQQITVLTQRVARFELERGPSLQISKKSSPMKNSNMGGGASGADTSHQRAASYENEYGDD